MRRAKSMAAYRSIEPAASVALMHSPHVWGSLEVVGRCRLVCRAWCETAEWGTARALVRRLLSVRLADATAAWLARHVVRGELDGLVGRHVVAGGHTALVRAGTSWPPAGAVGAALVAAAAIHGPAEFLSDVAGALSATDRACAPVVVDPVGLAWRHHRDAACTFLTTLGYRDDRQGPLGEKCRMGVDADDGDTWWCGPACPVCDGPTIRKTYVLLFSVWCGFAERRRREFPSAHWCGHDENFSLEPGQDDDAVDGEHMCPTCRVGCYRCDECRRWCRFLGGDGRQFARPGPTTIDPRDAGLLDLPAHYVGDLGIEWMSVADCDLSAPAANTRGTSVAYVCDGCRAHTRLGWSRTRPWEFRGWPPGELDLILKSRRSVDAQDAGN